MITPDISIRKNHVRVGLQTSPPDENMLVDLYVKLQQALKENDEIKKELTNVKAKLNKIEENQSQIIKVGNGNTITNNHGTINNTTNNTTNNINVKVVAFGKEDLSFITDQIAQKFLKETYYSIFHLIKHIHFNKEKPEFHNIYIPNKKDKHHLMINNGKRWLLRKRREIIDDLREKCLDYIEEKFGDLVDSKKLTNFVIDRVNKFLIKILKFVLIKKSNLFYTITKI